MTRKINDYIGSCKRCKQVGKIYSTSIGNMCRKCIDEEVNLHEFTDNPADMMKNDRHLY